MSWLCGSYHRISHGIVGIFSWFQHLEWEELEKSVLPKIQGRGQGKHGDTILVSSFRLVGLHLGHRLDILRHGLSWRCHHYSSLLTITHLDLCQSPCWGGYWTPKLHNLWHVANMLDRHIVANYWLDVACWRGPIVQLFWLLATLFICFAPTPL